EDRPISRLKPRAHHIRNRRGDGGQAMLAAREPADRATEFLPPLVLAEEPVGSPDDRRHSQGTVRECGVDEHSWGGLPAFEMGGKPESVMHFTPNGSRRSPRRSGNRAF